MNLAHLYVLSQGKTLKEAREEYDNACIDFAGDLLDHCGRGRLAWFETPDHPEWKYHAAFELDGVIHDLWESEPWTLIDYMERIVASEVDYPAEKPAETA